MLVVAPHRPVPAALVRSPHYASDPSTQAVSSLAPQGHCPGWYWTLPESSALKNASDQIQKKIKISFLKTAGPRALFLPGADCCRLGT